MPGCRVKIETNLTSFQAREKERLLNDGIKITLRVPLGDEIAA